ncbi:hypothetical protein Q8A67_019715 [Cirrhinus molitorella]|uniref:Uncharacterized protein n=1 Tax=Cirrhinus molitorella TaxID=172907 RepID=A0AA88P7N1_9TELE|nr:hypothetical protein Q8A67_019715 [Cirrhinus molitorella]
MGEHLDRRRQLKSRNSISELYLSLLLVVVSINPLQRYKGSAASVQTYSLRRTVCQRRFKCLHRRATSEPTPVVTLSYADRVLHERGLFYKSVFNP